MQACTLGLEILSGCNAPERRILQTAEILVSCTKPLLHHGARDRTELQNEQPPEQPPLSEANALRINAEPGVVSVMVIFQQLPRSMCGETSRDRLRTRGVHSFWGYQPYRDVQRD